MSSDDKFLRIVYKNGSPSVHGLLVLSLKAHRIIVRFLDLIITPPFLRRTMFSPPPSDQLKSFETALLVISCHRFPAVSLQVLATSRLNVEATLIALCATRLICFQ